MSDAADALTPPAPDLLEPASWSARAPDVAWAPDALVATVGAAFIDAASREPRTLSCTSDAWQVQGASVRGRSHAHRGEHRDDAIACDAHGDLVLLAVADGAGSSALSRIGAACAADIAVQRTRERHAADTDTADPVARLGTAMAHAVHDAAVHLHTLAATAELPPSAFRTTLILVAIAGDVVLVSQVGDGAVLAQKVDGSVVRVGAARDTMWAGEVACFVPEPCAIAAAAEFRQLRASEVSLLALMSDGIDDPFHPLEQSGAALIAQWRSGTTDSIGAARQPVTGPVLGDTGSLLRWLDFAQRGESDDRSLLLAWRPSVPVPAAPVR